MRTIVKVFACVVAEPDTTPSRATVKAILREAATRLAYYKLPGYIAFVDSLPVTATQKVRYGAVAELAQSLLRGGGPRLFDIRNEKRNYRPTH